MTNIYIDESGSINNNCRTQKYFIITLIVPTNKEKLDRVYTRFVKKHMEELRQVKTKNKMFNNEKFVELKGNQFDRNLKKVFVEYFAKKKHFEIYYIVINNQFLEDKFCENTSRAFNYVIRLALQYFIKNNYLKDDDYFLQLDERNEKTESKHFLQDYLNTELSLNGTTDSKFTVLYFDSSNNKFIQIADVFSNIMYSHLHTSAFEEEINLLKNMDILKCVFKFPLNN